MGKKPKTTKQSEVCFTLFMHFYILIQKFYCKTQKFNKNMNFISGFY